MGILDQFDANAGATDADQYDHYLKAEEVASAGQTATIRGFGVGQMEDGAKKPFVILQGTFGKGADHRRDQRLALILKRSNGNRLASAAKALGGEGALIGVEVDLSLGTTEFRGKPTPTVDLFVRGR